METNMKEGDDGGSPGTRQNRHTSSLRVAVAVAIQTDALDTSGSPETIRLYTWEKGERVEGWSYEEKNNFSSV